MGSIDIPPFLKEKMKSQIQSKQNTPMDNGESIPIPDFLKKNESLSPESSNGTSQSTSPTISQPNNYFANYSMVNSVPTFTVAPPKPKKQLGTSALSSAKELQQRNVSPTDQTYSIAAPRTMQQDENVAMIPEWNKQKAERAEKIQKGTPQAIKDAAIKSLKIKGLDPNNKALLNKAVSDFTDQVGSGNAQVNIDHDGKIGLYNNKGFFTSFYDNMMSAINEKKAAREFAKMTPKERVDFVNKREQEQQQTPYAGEKETAAGSVGGMLGGAFPTVGTYAAGAAAGGVLESLAPATGGASNLALRPIMSFVVNAGSGANEKGMQGTMERYQKIRRENPEMDATEAMTKAGEGEDVDRLAGIAEAALFSKVGGEMSEAKTVTGKLLKGTAQSVWDNGSKIAAVEGARGLGHQLEGSGEKPEEVGAKMYKAFEENATPLALLHLTTMGLTGLVKLPKIISSGAKYDVVTKMQPEEIDAALTKAVAENKITPELAQETANSLKEYKDALDKIPKGLSPESEASAAGIAVSRDNIKKQSEIQDETAKELTQQVIDSKNNQIKNIYRTDKPLEHEINETTGEPYKQPTYDEVAKANVKELADKISKGKRIEKPEELQTQANFPDQLKVELEKISKEEQSANKDKENPSTELSSNVNKYLKENATETEIPNPKEEASTTNEAANKVEQPTAEELVKRVEEKGVSGYKKTSIDEVGQQALQAPNSLKNQLGGDENLVTDLIAHHSEKQINDAIKEQQDGLGNNPTDQDITDVDNHIKLLEKGLEKRQSNTPTTTEVKSEKNDINLQSKNDNNAELSKLLPDTLSPTEKQGSIAGGEANAEATSIVGAIQKANDAAKERGEGLSQERIKNQEAKQLKSQTPKPISEERENKKIEKGVIQQAKDIEDLTDPHDIALQYFASGNKIHPNSLKKLFDSEGEKRARIGLIKKDAPTIPELAHQLWESNRGLEDNKYTTQDYENAIEGVLKDHNSPAQAAIRLVDNHVNKAVRETLSKEEYEAIGEENLSNLQKEVEGLDDGTKAELLTVLDKYQDKENGTIDWNKLDNDLNKGGFEPDLLNLSDNTQNKLNEIIKRNSEPSKPNNILSETNSSKEKEGKKESTKPSVISPEKIKKEQEKTITEIGEKKGGNEKEPPPETPKNEDNIHAEYPPVSLNYKGTGKLETEFGISEREPTKVKHDLETIKEADNLIENGWSVKKMLNKMENEGYTPSDAEYINLTKYGAELAGRLRELRSDTNSPEYTKTFNELNRVANLSNEVHGKQQGRSLGIRGRFKTVPEGSYADFMITERDVNNGAELTKQQKETAEKDYNKIEKVTQEAVDDISKLSELEAKDKAEKEFNKTKKAAPKKTKKTHEDFVNERKAAVEKAREALKKLRTGEGGLSAVPLPGVRELIAIAPHVKTALISLVEEGSIKLADAVKELHSEFKDLVEGLSEKNIHDILAGEYNAAKPTKRETLIRAEDLRREAELINKLETLLKAGTSKNEKVQRKRNQEINDLRNKIKDFKKEESEANKFYGENDSYERRISSKEDELQRLKDRIEKEPKEVIKKEISERERKLNEEIKAERAAFNKEKAEANKFYGGDKNPELAALRSLRNKNEKETGKVKERISKGDFSPEEKKIPLLQNKELKSKYPDAFNAALKARDELIKAKNELALRRAKQMYENKTPQEKTIEVFSKTLNIPRTVMASFDLSAPLRQGIIASVAHPVVAGRAMKFMIEAAKDEKVYNRWLDDVHSSPRFEWAEKTDLAITDPTSLHVKAHEEAFQGAPYAELIPLVGQGVKISERAYVGYLNKIRWDLFNMYVDRFEAQGKTFENNPELYKGISSFINSATGRGGIGIKAIDSASPILNWVFFASKLISSRLNMMGISDLPNLAVKSANELVRGATLGKVNPHWGLDFGFYSKLPKEIRVEAAKDMAKFVGVGIATLILAQQMGADVEKDPRSSDFGKIHIGNTRWDIWGGFQPYARVITQTVMAQRKATTTGKIYGLNGKGFMGETRLSPLASFGRGKLSPVLSSGINLASGRDMVGQPVTLGGTALSLVMPLLISDVIDAVKDRGVSAIFSVGIPSALGIGVQTFKPKAAKAKEGGNPFKIKPPKPLKPPH